MKKRKDILIQYKGEVITRNIAVDIGCVHINLNDFKCYSNKNESKFMFRNYGLKDSGGNDIWTISISAN